jgi:polysaccharide pyruvyl transferase WcaK-like protein
MNIAVFGWYHHRNAGDDRIQYCITRWLDGHTLAFLPAGRPPSLGLLKTYDAVIIGGGGIVTSRGGVFRNMARWTKAIGIPVALAGVSVERLSDALRTELRNFLDVCCFAWFRDQGSLDELGTHPRAFVAPDLTWLYPFPLVAHAPGGTALALRRHGGLDVAGWQRMVARLPQPVVGWPLYFENGGDAEALRRVLSNDVVPDEFSVEPLNHATAIVSMRYHGAIFGLQAGRPVVAVADQPKLTRFMDEAGLSEWRLSEAAIDDVPALLNALGDRRASTQEQVLALRESLTAAATKAGDMCRDRLLTEADRVARARPRWVRVVRRVLNPRATS